MGLLTLMHVEEHDMGLLTLMHVEEHANAVTGAVPVVLSSHEDRSGTCTNN